MQKGQKRGYLREDFRIFHLKDRQAPQVEYHYHEFNKLVLLISGGVTYNIEGVSYVMSPGDLLFVPHGAIHKPLILPNEEYERYVIYMMPEFLERHGRGLSVCFDAAHPDGLLRKTELNTRLELINRLSAIREARVSDRYMAELMAESLFVCFMITVCRVFLSNDSARDRPPADPKIAAVMEYIEQNLSGDLSVEKLSSVFFMSRYHLMRLFKAQSGYTLHNYITRRRVLAAAGLIGSGVPVTRAAEKCGYEDYSTFLRAFKSVFKVSPKSFATLSPKTDISDE